MTSYGFGQTVKEKKEVVELVYPVVDEKRKRRLAVLERVRKQRLLATKKLK